MTVVSGRSYFGGARRQSKCGRMSTTSSSSTNDRHCRDANGGRIMLWFITIILLITIPLCLIVMMSPPKIIVFWWAEEYDQVETSTKMNKDRSVPFRSKETDRSELLKVLLISYDGFRWDYIEKNNNTPTFRWLIENGVYATEGLKNTYITITAPNHYGIVTGLYEESHGIVANWFYGPEFNETFDYFDDRTRTDPRFFGGEPVWVTNDKAGDGRATGCQMWVGCDIPIKGRIPKHFVSWDGDLSWMIRVDSVIAWFKDPVDPINLGLLYIEEPDETGHMYGPDDPKTAAMVQKLDQLTAYLLWRLYSEDLLDKVNLIFTADHGMASVPWANVVNLDNYVNKSLYKVFGGTPNWNVMPLPGAEQQVYDALYNKVPHLSVYNKSTIPLDYHYTNTPHVLPLQFVSDIHWRLAHNDTVSEKNGGEVYRRKTRGRVLHRKLETSNATVGEHGYNNSLPDMHPYFIGHGPAFKQGYNISQFMNLDLYPLMCHILGIEPAPNNGSLERVRSILKNEGTSSGNAYHSPRDHFGQYAYPPWASGRSRVDHVSIVGRHYLPFTYSVNCDIFVMILLICVFIGMVMSLSAGLHRRRGGQRIKAKAPSRGTFPVKKEKCVINVVA